MLRDVLEAVARRYSEYAPASKQARTLREIERYAENCAGLLRTYVDAPTEGRSPAKPPRPPRPQTAGVRRCTECESWVDVPDLNVATCEEKQAVRVNRFRNLPTGGGSAYIRSSLPVLGDS